jgi:hypothetical protein
VEPTAPPQTQQPSRNDLVDDNDEPNTSTPSPSVMVLSQPTPTSSSTTTTTSSAITNDDNSSTIKISVLSVCAVVGLVLLILTVLLMVKIKKSRYYHYNNKSLRQDVDNNNMGWAILNFGTKKSRELDEFDDDDEDDVFTVPDQDMDITQMMDLEDEKVLSGYIQNGDSTDSASWASENNIDNNDNTNNTHRNWKTNSTPGNIVESGDDDRTTNDEISSCTAQVSGERHAEGEGSDLSLKPSNDVESGNYRSTEEMSPSPFQISGNQQVTEEKEDLLYNKTSTDKAAGTATSSRSFWPSFALFKATKETESSVGEKLDQLSCVPPDHTQEMSSSFAGAGTDGTLSDAEDVMSIGPESVNISTSHESFEIRPLQDYIVKKDMLESSATARGPVGATTTMKRNNSNSQKKQEQDLTSTSNPPDLSCSESNVEEDPQQDEVMMLTPYFRLPFNGTPPIIDRSSSCVLQATDVSAATLAQRSGDGEDGNIHDDDDEHNQGSNRSTLIRMVPSMSSPGSWWRNTTPSHNVDRKTFSGAAVQEREDDDTSFVPSPCDGWDPADWDASSKGASVPTEELFKLAVDNKTGQSLVEDFARSDKKVSQNMSQNISPFSATTENNDSTIKSSMKKNGNIGKSAEFQYTDYELDEGGSISSDESISLKLDSSYCF